MDSRRLADVRAGTRSAMLAGGSGYLVASHVVLTARHVVVDESGAGRPRITVWLGHPAERRAKCRAGVQWADRDLDLALLRLDIDPPLPIRRFAGAALSAPSLYDMKDWHFLSSRITSQGRA